MYQIKDPSYGGILFVIQGLAGGFIHAHNFGGVLDDDPFLRVGMFGKERFYDLAVTHQDDRAVQFTNGKGRSLNDRLGSMVAPHGINGDLHGSLPEDFSDLFDLHNLPATVKSTMGANPVGDLGLTAFGTAARGW